MEQQAVQKIIPRVIEDEMKKSYLDYSMSVIVGRALPDVRDGLKPVHRRVLFGMHELSLSHNKPFKKCARIVGDVLGKYHPHGDMAVYDSLVRMAQDFSMRYPLVKGQGNFGSIDGDAPASMRYTEARLNLVAEEMLADIDKDTVDFVPNFDGSLKEPSILPSKFPNLLVNGSSGIAVGMATNIPPHNLKEVCAGITYTIEHPECTVEELMQLIQGPDFPTGGIVLGMQGLKEAYKTGKGRVTVRARTNIEEAKGRQRIIVTEIPYMVNKSQLLEQIAELAKEKKIVGISDIRDESDREGMRIVIELKTGANTDVLLNQLFTHTRLQETFGIITLALVDNEPKILALKDLVSHYINYRKLVVTRRTKFELREAEEKEHLLAGIIIALDNIDSVIALIKAAKSGSEAKQRLIQQYALSEKQAQAILDIKLSRLTTLEQEKVRQERAELLKLIEELKSILSSEQRILDIIKQEISELSERFGDDRRTQLLGLEAVKIEQEQLVKPEEDVVTVTHAGYVKRLTIETYKLQRRGGKGVLGTETKEEDFVERIFIANTLDSLLLFTNHGKVHWLKVYQIPEAGRYAKGTAVVNLVQLEQGENVNAFIPVKQFTAEKYLLMVTKKGIIKKTSLEEFSNPRKGGIIAVTLDEADELIGVEMTDGKRHVILATQKGLALRFDEKATRAVGRTARGVIGIRLKQGDAVVAATIADDAQELLTVTKKGYGKRTAVSEYRVTGRGGLGVTNVKITEKNGEVAGVKSVTPNDEVILISKNGVVVRIKASQVSDVGRAAQGVRLMRLEEGDAVMSVAIVKGEETQLASNQQLQKPPSTETVSNQIKNAVEEANALSNTLHQANSQNQ